MQVIDYWILDLYDGDGWLNYYVKLDFDLHDAAGWIIMLITYGF